MMHTANAEFTSQQANRWFYLFVAIHLFVWTLAPLFIRHNLPMDSIEGSMWGHQLALGYDKNPFLNGWLTAFAMYVGGASGLVYLFSQLSVVLCFWAVWRLAKEMLSPLYALFSVMLLETMQYYNFHAIDFNDNNLELSLWTLAIYFFYRALTRAKLNDWLWTACWLGLGMMAKYYTAALIAAMAIFLISHAPSRQQLKTCKPYAALLLFLLILLPHTVWLFYHQFITITYVFDRTSAIPSLRNHFFFPMQFAWQQFEVFLPALLLFMLIFMLVKPHRDKRAAFLPYQNFTFNRAFITSMALGPLLLTLLLSLALGIKLRAGWGMPLLSLWGIGLFFLLPMAISRRKCTAFIVCIYCLISLFVTAYANAILNATTPSSANFPGREIATTMTQTWHELYHTPLPFVAGPRWINGNIAFYSADHPTVFSEWDLKRAFWINTQQLEQQGAIFTWNISDGETLPVAIQNAYPRLIKMKVLTFEWDHNRHHLAPIEIGMAILPPANLQTKL